MHILSRSRPLSFAIPWSAPGLGRWAVLMALAVPGVAWCGAAEQPRAPAASALKAAPGTIEGRVVNAATGARYELARITVAGTLLETFTDADGRFRLANVPAGSVQLTVFHTGLGSVVRTVPVGAAETVWQELEVSSAGGPIRLDAFVVGDSREMSGTAIAINEQRFAPNLRNVVSTDEFGYVPDGNVAEFLKFLPGVSMNSAREISINGVPSANIPVTIGGFSVASPIGSGGDGGTARSNSMDVFSTTNVSRIEVSFSPTPESDGSALAGTVNLVPRSSFERTRPAFSGSTYVSLLNNGRDFGQPSPYRKVHPGFDFNWVVPVSRTFGYTLAAGHSIRQTDTPVIQNVWRGGGSVTNGTTFPHTPYGQPYLTSIVAQATGRKTTRRSFAASVDYQLGRNDRLTVGVQASTFDVIIDHATLTLDAARVLPGQFGLNFTKGAAGAGTAQLGTTSSLRHNWSYLPSAVWRHDGLQWRLEAGLGVSRARNRTRNIDDGLFGTTTARRTGLTVAFDEVGYWRPRTVTVTDGVTGAPVDPFALSNYVVTAANGTMRATDDTRRSAYANLRRDFGGSVPLTLKAGLDVRDTVRDGRGFTGAYTYLGRDGVASTVPAGSDDLAVTFANPTFAQRIQPNDFPRVPGISSGLLYRHYLANPAQFGAPSANTLYRSEVSLSSVAEEVVSSGYLRGDLALFRHRLKLVGGVRAEQTNIDARGPLTDPTRNFQRNPQGDPVLGANGRPLTIIPATDALGVSRLTYLDRGSRTRKEYLRLFPSVNASYNVREDLIARAAVYTSVGRPDFSQYSGGLSLPDTESPPSNSNRIVVNNASIKAWSAGTVNVRLEYYFAGVGQFSVGAFRREFRDFFGDTVVRAQPELLAPYGLDFEEYRPYDVATQYNLPGRVRVEGTTVNYKQALGFLPAWARGVQVFGNLSLQRAVGDAAANFAGYVPKTANWGASLTRERVVIHANWNYRGRARRGIVAAGSSIEPGTYNWGQTRLVTDVIVEYRFTRRFAFFANLRNLWHVSDELEIAGPSTPAVARLRQSGADFGSLWTIGAKGAF
jgi:iron complex outermembrane receptor protein